MIAMAGEGERSSGLGWMTGDVQGIQFHGGKEGESGEEGALQYHWLRRNFAGQAGSRGAGADTPEELRNSSRWKKAQISGLRPTWAVGAAGLCRSWMWRNAGPRRRGLMDLSSLV